MVRIVLLPSLLVIRPHYGKGKEIALRGTGNQYIFRNNLLGGYRRGIYRSIVVILGVQWVILLSVSLRVKDRC